eukprot:TRINITY_DN8915_c0_g1_i3.p3 TRINITY_DN8915_c0_g1~~TRINITY_DN8915_c0_g1_i3.p3  ORF type:complete len:121 (-),score=40.76 TRINITY_DN8915_c0_g1_i3:464-826(-)
MLRSLVGSEMCIRDRYQRRVRGVGTSTMATPDASMSFEEATNFVRGWESGAKASNDEKLKMYGLFKQSTVGNVNMERPGFLSFEGRSKWDAWKKVEGMEAEEAKTLYVEELVTQFQKYGA